MFRFPRCDFVRFHVFFGGGGGWYTILLPTKLRSFYIFNEGQSV